MKATHSATCSNCSATDHLRRDCPLVKCISCGRLGHFKEDCPNEKKRARAEEDGDGSVCRSCGSSRHVQASCPLRNQTMECFQCHQRGHMMPTCPLTRCFNCGSYGHSSQLCHSRPLCFHCSLAGHISTKCPMKQKGRVCYRCKEPGHEMSECTQNVVCHMCNQTGHLLAQCPEALCSRCHEKGHIASSCSKLRCHICSGQHPTLQCTQNSSATGGVMDGGSLETNSNDTDSSRGDNSDASPATVPADIVVPPFEKSGVKCEGRVAVIIDGGYFERALKDHKNRDEAQFKRTVEVLRYTLDFLGEVFQKEPVAYWFDTDPAAFTEYIEHSMPLAHREKAFRESNLRKRLLADEMNGGRRLSNVVARLVGRMKLQKGYTRDGPRQVWVQTGVDVAIATCVIETFIHRQFEQVVLLCGDADLYPAVQYCHTQRRISSALEKSNPVRMCGTSSSMSKVYGRDQDLSDFLPRILLDLPRHTEGHREVEFPTHTMFL
ncbi:putative nucleic acid binding protein [Trypanosoma grayi]|uniref:putative nucleic acid binding protein n=1 Tax=Trypanosoma grayi TaxID=71804 RepID=UPI0004F44BB1|nr:putative nucleic acid binding protein [Trypanosoma grayi]KEG10606.1 putative nucleic acid binding protein [Trypanosoma grayi]